MQHRWLLNNGQESAELSPDVSRTLVIRLLVDIVDAFQIKQTFNSLKAFLFSQ